MNDALVPEWMKRKRAEDELAEARKEADRQRAIAASLLLQTEAPKFWNRLQEKLAIAVDSLPVLKLTGSFSKFGGGVRVQVSYRGTFTNEYAHRLVL